MVLSCGSFGIGNPSFDLTFASFNSLISLFDSLISFGCLRHLFERSVFVIFLAFIASAKATSAAI